jgi:hypothetical protein
LVLAGKLEAGKVKKNKTDFFCLKQGWQKQDVCISQKEGKTKQNPAYISVS